MTIFFHLPIDFCCKIYNNRWFCKKLGVGENIMSETAQQDSAPAQYRAILPYAALGLGCVFYFYEFLLQTSTGVMGPEWMRDFSVTAHTLGMVAAAYFVSYACTQILVGLLVDRYGPHIWLTIAAALCGVSSIVLSMAQDIFTVGLARFVIGFGSAFAVISTFKLAANWFSHRRFALITGIVVTLGMLGAISAEAPLAHAIDAVGWRQCIFFLGIFGIVLSTAIFFFVRDCPQHASRKKAPPARSSLREGIRHIFSNRHIWLVAAYGGLMFCTTPTLCGLWGVPYLMQKYAISKTAAGGLVSLVFFGWVFGSPLAGWMSDKIGRRKPPMICGSIGALIMISLTLYSKPSIHMMPVILFLFGFFSSGFLPAFTIAREITKPRYTATGLGFMNMMNMFGVPVAQQLIGYLLDELWTGNVSSEGVRIYSQSSYEMAMMIFPGAILLSIILLPFIRETYCRQVAHD